MKAGDVAKSFEAQPQPLHARGADSVEQGIRGVGRARAMQNRLCCAIPSWPEPCFVILCLYVQVAALPADMCE